MLTLLCFDNSFSDLIVFIKSSDEETYFESEWTQPRESVKKLS